MKGREFFPAWGDVIREKAEITGRTHKVKRTQQGGGIPKLQRPGEGGSQASSHTSTYTLPNAVPPQDPKDTWEDTGPPKTYRTVSQAILLNWEGKSNVTELKELETWSLYRKLSPRNDKFSNKSNVCLIF